MPGHLKVRWLAEVK